METIDIHHWELLGAADIMGLSAENYLRQARTKLGTSMRFCGVHFHIEAFEVRRDETGELRAVDPTRNYKIEQILEVVGDDQVELALIVGRHYLICATPYLT